MALLSTHSASRVPCAIRLLFATWLITTACGGGADSQTSNTSAPDAWTADGFGSGVDGTAADGTALDGAPPDNTARDGGASDSSASHPDTGSDTSSGDGGPSLGDDGGTSTATIAQSFERCYRDGVAVADCAPPLICLVDAEDAHDGMCVMPCASDSECSSPETCAQLTDGEHGVCVIGRGLGEPCDDLFDGPRQCDDSAGANYLSMCIDGSCRILCGLDGYPDRLSCPEGMSCGEATYPYPIDIDGLPVTALACEEDGSSTNVWRPMTSTDAPRSRSGHTAVWTGAYASAS
ncbi:MAG: hypothetical protein H6729_15135 [Deltaproteobacteria bacterium]|nr:hypothetical protein [Deltaproteobacteria bacterium]